MRMTTINNSRVAEEAVDLFKGEMPSVAKQLRNQEQRDRLVQRAKEVAKMLDRLDGQLSIDRERAVAMLAEYTGLLDLVVEDIRAIRDIDEDFGAGNRQPSKLAPLALQLERGVAYLQGLFSVVVSSDELPVYNWKLVHRDVQEVLATSRLLISLHEPSAIRKAA